MPISSPEEERPRRRKRARGWPLALEEGEKRALVDSLTDRVLPTFDFFLFILLATLLACVGFGLHSTTLLLAAALVAPLLAPLGGISLGLAAALPRYVGRNLLGVVLGAALAFLLAALLGMACRLVFPRAGVLLAESPGLTWADLAVVLVGSVWMANRLAREPGGARLPSAALAYLVLIPIMAAGRDWATTGLSASLTPVLCALASLFLAIVGGQMMFLLLGIRPTPESLGAWATALGAVISVDLCVLALVALGPRAPLGVAAQPTSTPRAPLVLAPTLTFTPSPTTTPTAVPSPGRTPSPTPEPSATPTPIPVVGVIYGTNGKGALLRDQPGGKIVSSVEEGVGVEMIGEPESASGLEWILVRDGQGHQGWLALQFFATITPTLVP
jgi:hypothetical protein